MQETTLGYFNHIVNRFDNVANGLLSLAVDPPAPPCGLRRDVYAHSVYSGIRLDWRDR